MNGNIKKFLLSICILHVSSMTVRCFLSGVRLFMSQLCLWYMSWLPGNTIHCWLYSSFASSKNLYEALSTSISRYRLSWYRSPSMIAVSIPESLQYSRITLQA